jgi:hypothetical protein
MPLHKAPDNSIHDDMDGAALHLLPAGCVPITREEAEAYLPKPSPELIIEAKKQTVRALREVVLGRLLGIKDAARDDNDLPLVEACRVARRGLLDITKYLPPDPQLAELTMVTRYVQIREAAVEVSSSLELAFAQVDA